jgi:thiamine thiazole synthase
MDSILTTKHGKKEKMEPPFKPSKEIPQHFKPIHEVDVTRAMIDGFSTDWKHASHSDIIIVGAGMTGLVAAYQLSKLEGLKVTIVDKHLQPGGSVASGSQFFNTVVIRKPAHQILLELDIPFTENENYVTVRNPSNIISALLDKTLNHSKSEFVFLGNLDVADYLFRGKECCGISAGFGSGSAGTSEDMHTLGSSAGFNKSAPFPFFADVVISACGARSSYSRLRNLGWIDPYYNYSADSMDMNISEG